MSGNNDKILRDELSKLDLVPWADAQVALETGDAIERRIAVHALMPAVMDVAAKYRDKAIGNGIRYEDIIGEGNLILMEAIESWKPDGYSLRNWVYWRLRRDIPRFIGKELNWTVNVEDLDDDMLLENSVDGEATHEDSVLFNQIKDNMHEVLTVREAAIIKGIYYQHLTETEVADFEGISRQAVNKFHHIALNKMQTWLLDSDQLV